jgi:glycosyltransferase involved in cell wall biosynthesis
MGTAELIEHEVTGLLCDGSPAEIARAVIRLTGHPEEARALGRRAQRFARRTFSNERCTRASLDVLRRALESAPAPSAQTRAASPVSRGDERSERYSS